VGGEGKVKKRISCDWGLRGDLPPAGDARQGVRRRDTLAMADVVKQAKEMVQAAGDAVAVRK
jgi:hypothetical protein